MVLPNDLNDGSVENLYVHYFQSDKNAQKTKIKLNSNLLSFLVEGKKEIFYKNEFQSIDNEHFLLAKSGNCLMTEQLSDNKQYKSILLFFSDDFLEGFKSKHKQIFDKKNTDVSVFLRLKYDDFIKNYLQSLLFYLNSNQKTSQAILQIKLEEILLYLIERNGSQIVDFLSANQNIKKDHKFIKIVESNIYSKLTLEELAFLCNMSLSTFKREFQKTYGLAPNRWFQNKRLEQSATILKSKTERPSDIYQEVGYQSLSSFTQSFKQKFGVTPKKFQLQQN